MSETNYASVIGRRWDEMAEYYEDFLEPVSSVLVDGVFSLVGGIGPGDSVLDLAAGTGGLAIEAARRGAQVLAVDASQAMVARISDRLKMAALPNGDACVMDGQALDLADATFNKAFSMFGIAVFPDWRKGFQELARVIRPGGYGCVGVFPIAEGGPQFRLLYEAYRLMAPTAGPLPVSPTFALLMREDILRDEMVVAGFRNVSLHTVNGSYYPRSADWLLDHCDHLFQPLPFYQTLDSSGQHSLRDAMRTVFRSYETTDGYRVPNSATVAVGSR